jgi:flagellar hook-associated protein 1 FlgK
MATLLTSLATAGQALEVYQQALNVVQNNITNSSTPGFATQSLNLEAEPFDSAGGLAGGVAARGVSSARDEYAEEEVRRQAQSLGYFQAQAQGASSIENLFDVTGGSGVPADLSALFQSFSAWSVSPSSANARQSVIASAGNLASDVQSLASGLAGIAGDVQGQIGSTVDQINQLTATIQKINAQRSPESSDPASDALLTSSLQQLSTLVDIDTVSQADGTVSVLMKGGSPLVVGDTQYAISSGLAASGGTAGAPAPPSSQILDSQGNDITSQVQGGTLGGLLNVSNSMLPSLIGNSQQAGSLNQFAQTFADAVNGILESGTTGPESGAAKGAALFVYDASDPTAAAGTFALNPDITPDELAPVDASGNANGNANQLAALADAPSASAGNRSFTDFFGQIAAAVGQYSATAQENQQAQQQVLTQTETLRDQSSGVSLDAQAALLLQYQRSYQAAAQLLTTLNTMMDTTFNMMLTT